MTISNPTPRANAGVEALLKVGFAALIALGVWFWLRPSVPNEAKKFVSGLMQNEQNQFPDQYTSSSELSNKRGVVILVDSKKYYDLKGISLNNGYRYTLYLLLRDQQYENTTYFAKYRRISYKEAPSQGEIEKQAKEFDLLD
jgi:hypothetical protein